MGIVAKQGGWNLAILLAGFGMGAITTMFIFPKVFPDGDAAKDWGVIQLMLSYAVIGGEFLSLGSARAAIFFHARSADRESRSVLNSYLWILPGIILAVFSIVFSFFPEVFDLLIKDEYTVAQVQRYYLPLVVLFYMTVYFNSAGGYAMALMQTVFQAFLTEIFIRIGVLVVVALFFFGWINFDGMIAGYVIVYTMRAVLQLVYLNKIAYSGIRWNLAFSKKIVPQLRYGIYAVLDSGAALLVNRLDMVMIGAFMEAQHIAFYSIALFIAMIVQLPSRALIPISAAVLSKAWSENDMKTIHSVYFKTSLNLFITGGVILMVIWFSLDNVLAQMPEDYRDIHYIFLYLALAKWVHMAFGINGGILLTSPNYRVSFYLNLFLLIITFITNYLLIPVMGAPGAALSTLISVFVFNILRFGYLLYRYQMQPFRKKHLYSAIILGVGWVAGTFIPIPEDLPNLVSALVRSIVILTITGVPLYVFGISQELNAVVKKGLRMMRIR